MNNYHAVLFCGFVLYWATFYSFTYGDVGSGTSAHQSNPLKPSLKSQSRFDQFTTILGYGDSSNYSPESERRWVYFSPDVIDGSHRSPHEYRTHKTGNKERVWSHRKTCGDLGWTHTTFANNILKNEETWSTDRNLLLSPVGLEVSLVAFFSEFAMTEELLRLEMSLLRVDVMVPRSPLIRWMFPPNQRFRLSRRRLRNHYSNILQLISVDSVNINSILYFGNNLGEIDKNAVYLLKQYFKTKSYSTSKSLEHRGKPVPLVGNLPPALQKNYKAYSYILASTLSFRGKWKIKFDQKLTRANYFIGKKSKKLVTFISKTGKYYYVDKQEESYKIIGLQFEENNGPFSLLIFLPYGTNSLEDLENHLANRRWLQGLDLTGVPSTLVYVSVPRFSVQDSWNFKEFLREGTNLETGIIDTIHGIVQRVFLSIDESGATSDTMTTPTSDTMTTPGYNNIQMKAPGNSPSGSETMTDHPPVTFVADRPFMFALVHRTEKTILLQGHIVD